MKSKRILTLFISVVLFLTVMPTASSARTLTNEQALRYTIEASYLKELGLFKGVSDTDFDLYRPATRVEAIVMIIRLLGEENTALNAHLNHPFTDVPAWADDYIGYAYTYGITSGVSQTEFGTGYVSSAMYITYLLRVLGFSDSNGEFSWDNPYDLAYQVGILDAKTDQFCNLSEFWRGDMAFLSSNALTADAKTKDKVILSSLVEKEVFSPSKPFFALSSYLRNIELYFPNEIYGEDQPVDTLQAHDSTDSENTVSLLEPFSDDSEVSQGTSTREQIWTEDEPAIYTIDEEPEAEAEETVYITPSGVRYHIDPDCGGVNSYPVSLSEALRRGKTPCQKCVH